MFSVRSGANKIVKKRKINRKLHRKRQAEVEPIKSSEKISCSVGTVHPDKGFINISLV